MKKEFLSGSLALCMLLTSTVPVFGAKITYKNEEGRTIELSDFKDTQNHWAHDVILKWADFGLIAGAYGNFMPNNPIKRGDLAIILDRMLNLKTTSYNFYDDLPMDSYYRQAVLRCVAAGYISGISSNKVAPEGYATREQVAVILCRMFNINTSYTGYSGFVDDAKIGDWARGSVIAMKRLGYMNGTHDGKCNPKANITRAELIQILNNIANTYIPKRDNTDSGDVFKGDFPSNVVTARSISLNYSTIGRDLILTHSCGNVVLTDSQVKGRILSMAKQDITLRNSKVNQIYLNEGKSTITGITSDVGEIYIAEYASESSLDKIPDKLVLEPGVRVRIDGTFYENDSNKNKTYYGIDVKADIAAEQGYVTGGPKVFGAVFKQEQDNTINVQGVRITKGDNAIKEVGVVWLDQEDDEDIVVPTYQNCDGYTVFKSDKFEEEISFKVDNVKGLRTYRVYVKDSEGLYGYSGVSTFEEYEFSISMKLFDEGDYPEFVNAEVVLQGDKVPTISSVKVVYGTDELYSENHSRLDMKRYVEQYVENPIDSTKYQRFIAEIPSIRNYDTATGKTIFTPPTVFGYIITFTDGKVINKYPVLKDAIPAGVKPISTLTSGTSSFSGSDKIIISNNRLVTSHVAVQEVGIVYRESTSNTVPSPNTDSNGWKQVRGGSYIPANNSFSWSSTLNVTDKDANTFYAPYVKTSSGYYYGNVSKISNNWQADEGGYILNSVNAVALGDGEILFTVEASETLSPSATIDLGPIGTRKLSNLELRNAGKTSYFVVRGLTKGDVLSIPLRITKENGSRSNVVNMNVSTSPAFRYVNKRTENGNTLFTLQNQSNCPYPVSVSSASLKNSSSHIFIPNSTDIRIEGSVNTVNEVVNTELTCRVAFGSSLNIAYKFNLALPLY